MSPEASFSKGPSLSSKLGPSLSSKLISKLGSSLRLLALLALALLFISCSQPQVGQGSSQSAASANSAAANSAAAASSLPLLQRDCDAGHMPACRGLGASYLVAMPPDFAKAAQYSQRACDADDAMACANLAFMHELGQGFEIDAKKAQELFDRACLLGEASVCHPGEGLHQAPAYLVK